jgi:hypothetical protein
LSVRSGDAIVPPVPALASASAPASALTNRVFMATGATGATGATCGSFEFSWNIVADECKE